MSTKKKPATQPKTAKATSLRGQDPQASREALQYENPLPSRELIMSSMAEQGVPLNVETLYHLLEIGIHEREIFNRRLNAMEREGQIMRNRKGALCLAEKLHLIAGVVHGHPDGFGFLIPDDKVATGSQDLFLSNKEMSQVLHGDRVMVRMAGLDRKGRPEGKIVEVLERKNRRLVGRVIREKGITLIAAEDKRINQDILIPYHLDMGAKPGQVVMVELTAQPSSGAQPIGQVVEVLGNYADSGMEIEIALRKHELPNEFPKEAVKQVEKYPKLVQPKDYAGRIDLRELPLITIDGETARDFDDAVFCEPQGKGWRLVVAIADVSYYVRPGDALDKEALLRGNSVYFPRRVIPMLPEALSNGLCSLNPDVERMCMVCDMQIDSLGKIKQYQFYPSVMRSKARMTYTKVFEMLQAPTGALAQEYAWLMPHVQNLNALFNILLKAREQRGAVEFESSETLLIFNENGKIDRIESTVRNGAHRIIEECMLAANVCAANFLSTNEHAAVYRIHEGPTPEKLEALRTFMKEFGFDLTGGDTPHAKDYAKLMSKIKGRPDEQLLQTVMLRSMQQAVYSPDNVGHFGLGYEAYTHFTSPIRRYPDLLVHRAIKAVLEGKQYNPAKAKIEGADNWQALGQHCSMTERRADDATRDVYAWLKCYYMQDKVGEVYEGTVSGVTSFGLFVALDNIFIEGLLHVTELGNDYFNYDKARHQMLGERTGVRFRLGDRVTIKVARVDLETSKIDFSLMAKTSVDSEMPVFQTAENSQPALAKPRLSKPRLSKNTSSKSTPAKVSPYAAKSKPTAKKTGSSSRVSTGKSNENNKPTKTKSNRNKARK